MPVFNARDVLPFVAGLLGIQVLLWNVEALAVSHPVEVWQTLASLATSALPRDFHQPHSAQSAQALGQGLRVLDPSFF